MTKRTRPYDSSDEADVARAKRREHNQTQAEINDLQAIMKTKAGRATMWRLLSRTGVYRTSFSESGTAMAFNEGRRDIGLYYIAKLTEHCLEYYQTMEREQRYFEQLNKGDDE